MDEHTPCEGECSLQRLDVEPAKNDSLPSRPMILASCTIRVRVKVTLLTHQTLDECNGTTYVQSIRTRNPVALKRRLSKLAVL